MKPIKKNVLIIAAVVLALAACDPIFDCTKGEGPVVSQTISLNDFHSFTLTGSGKVYISQGEAQEVRVEAQQNIINLLNRRVNDGHWNIDISGCTRKIEEPVYYITLPEIRAMKITGSGDVYGEGTLETGDLDVRITGSGKLTADVIADHIDVEITGSGDVRLSGESETAELKISGSGELSAYELFVQSYDIKISGSGDAKVYAEENLNVRISGSGSVSYKGTPAVNSNITGSGKVVNRN